MSAACILCGATETTKLFEKGGKDFVRCPGCGLVRLDPLPSTAEIAAHYEAAYAGGSYTIFIEADEARHLIARHRLERMRGVARHGRWLDIGCSMGHFVEAATRAGVLAQGIDVSPGAVRLGRDRGLDVHVASVEDFRPEGTFDAITAFDVIEHSNDPRDFLHRVREWISPGGALVLTLPDVSSVYARVLMRKHWFYYAPEDHVYYFDPKTIRSLLHGHGFRVHTVERSYKPMSLRYVAGQLRHFNPLLAAPLELTNRLLPAALVNHPWEVYVGEMWVVAERA